MNLALHDIASDGQSNETLSETAYRKIRRDIINGELPPAKPLRLEQLRARYGLSFSPIREALNRLQSERLVVAAALRGFSVAPLSREEIRDTTDVRILIETEALKRSIENGDNAWEVSVVAAFHTLSWLAKRITQKSKPTNDEAEELEVRHREFHQALISCCRSPKLLDSAFQLYVQSERYRRPALIGHGTFNSSRNVALEHKNIMEAVLGRNTKKAVALLAEHYRRTADSIEKLTAFPGQKTVSPSKR